MIKSWDEEAWEDYLYWQQQDKKTLKKINNLIKEISREGYKDAEPLKHELSGFYSRRIDQKNRLVFKIIDDTVYILQCRTHYQK